MGFLEHLQQYLGKEAILEKVQASVHGTRYTCVLEFTPGRSRGERVILREVWRDCILIEFVETHERREIPIDRVELKTLTQPSSEQVR